MKRVFEEISDDEWENHNHSFKPSRVLNTTTNPNPPAIESFAYGSSKQNPKEDIVFDLEDDDEDVAEAARPSVANRGRRFVVEDEESDGDDGDKDADIAQVYNVKSSDEEGNVEEEAEAEEEEEEEDVVAKALQKCAMISAELKRDLYGSSVTACDRYAEVESSSVRIVTQDDVDAACKSQDSDFQPVLKPYQLVGVNFLLLLYQKDIGGDSKKSVSQSLHSMMEYLNHV